MGSGLVAGFIYVAAFKIYDVVVYVGVFVILRFAYFLKGAAERGFVVSEQGDDIVAEVKDAGVLFQGAIAGVVLGLADVDAEGYFAGGEAEAELVVIVGHQHFDEGAGKGVAFYLLGFHVFELVVPDTAVGDNTTGLYFVD